MVLECAIDALYGLRGGGEREREDANKCGISYLCGIFKGNMYRDNLYTEDSLEESMQRCAMMLWVLIK